MEQNSPNRLFYCVFLILAVLTTSSCTNDIRNSAEIPVKIIFDTDMGSDCDDVGALALLHAYADLGKAEIIGCIYSSGAIPFGAGVIEAINIYYNRPNIPVGASIDFDFGDPVDKMTAEKLSKDTTAFRNKIIHNSDATEQTRLTRQLLSDQDDSSIVYVTVGHTQGLYSLLTSPPDDISPMDGKKLVSRKIKHWVALGALNAANENNNFTKDWNFFFNGTAPYTKYLIENFPVPVYIVDAGAQVMTGKSLQYSPSGNIVRTAYRDWLWNVEKKTLDDQRPSWDLAAVYFAVEGKGVFLRSLGEGYLEFDEDLGCRWHADSAGTNQTFIIQKDNVNENFASYLNQMIFKK